MIAMHAKGTNAKWAVELERIGSPVEYLAAESILLDGDSLRIVLSDQAVMEFSRESIRKLLIMKTTNSSLARTRKSRSNKKSQ